ncbi:hypothetical protein Aperf_G00000111023 [Anoplocephala perfoliata]
MDQHQMPCWYFEKEDFLRTPSAYDGIDQQTENQYRRDGARFILDLSTRLHLRYDTWATAIVFFHRFYMCHSFKAFPRHVTAACCLMLAGKVEETPKKCRDIIRMARSILSPELFATFGSDPREEVMMHERVLLKTIKFDLQVTHPYSFLLQYAKRFRGPQDKIKEIVQMAWSFINDSLETTLCLQWEPEIVACAVLYLATRMKSFQVTDWQGKGRSDQPWWECFVEGMTVEVMEDICHRILDIYADGKSGEDVTAPSTSTAPTHSITPSQPSSSVGMKSRTQRTPSPPPPPPPPPQPSTTSSSFEHSGETVVPTSAIVGGITPLPPVPPVGIPIVPAMPPPPPPLPPAVIGTHAPPPPPPLVGGPWMAPPPPGHPPPLMSVVVPPPPSASTAFVTAPNTYPPPPPSLHHPPPT